MTELEWPSEVLFGQRSIDDDDNEEILRPHFGIHVRYP